MFLFQFNISTKINFQQNIKKKDVIVRASTGTLDRRPYSYIAALLRALPAFGKIKINTTLLCLQRDQIQKAKWVS